MNPEIHCIQCGALFLPKHRDAKLCSDDCRLQRRKSQALSKRGLLKEWYCECCGTRHLTKRKKMYCDKQCLKRAYKTLKRGQYAVNELVKSFKATRAKRAQLQEAYEAFKPLSEQVNDRFKEAQIDKSSEDAFVNRNKLEGSARDGGVGRINIKRKTK